MALVYDAVDGDEKRVLFCCEINCTYDIKGF